MGLAVSISEAHSRVCEIHDTPAEVAQGTRMLRTGLECHEPVDAHGIVTADSRVSLNGL